MENEALFCNPVPFKDGKRHTNPDPYVMRWCGQYYCYATDEDGVKISRSDNLVDWEFVGYGIKDPKYTDFWAPSVLYWNGKFYMYYSNREKEDTGDDGEWLKLAVSDSPIGPFIWKKTFFDKFSIDSHPVIWNGKLYMFYSVNDWIGADEKVAGTIIVLDEMLSPEEFAGNPIPVLLPSLEQEIFAKNRYGDGRDWYTLEGAAVVTHGNQSFLTYSANAYVNVDYFVGTAVAPVKENLSDMTWKKYPSEEEWVPLLKKNEKVEGTGHNTIVKAPNMVDDWIVYHGRMAEEELIPGLEQREMRIDPLYFNGMQMVCDGPSYDFKGRPAMPEFSVKDKYIEQEMWLTTADRFYRAEYWISAELKEIGCKYEIYLAWKDAANYVKLRMETGKSCVNVIQCSNMVERILISEKIEKGYKYSVPHLITVDRKENCYTIELDNKYVVTALADMTGETAAPCKIGIKPFFTKLHLHSFALTEMMDLQGEQLIHMADNYVFLKPVCVDASGLTGKQSCMELLSKGCMGDYTEEIQLQPVKKENCLVWFNNDKMYKMMDNSERAYAVYHYCKDGRHRIVVNGKPVELTEKSRDNIKYGIRLKNMKIVQYQFTKN